MDAVDVEIPVAGRSAERCRVQQRRLVIPTDDDRLNLTDVHFVHDEEPQRLAVSDPRAGNDR